MSTAFEEFSILLGMKENDLRALEEDMAGRLGRNVIEKLAEENKERSARMLRMLELGEQATKEEMVAGLEKAIYTQEAQVLKFLESVPGNNQFEKAAELARRVAKPKKGYFLKKEFAEHILRERPPQHLLEHFHYTSVDELLKHHEVTEAFSALRFMESDEWMHETFDAAYSAFSPNDFEERDIEIRVLGSEWEEVAKAFVAKKHHNVSHLKEFGVIFLNPIREDLPGKFLRDFALLMHYFHEIEFYAKLFRRYSQGEGFSEKFKMLLRGDLPEKHSVEPGEWLIIQRYLFKIDPADVRLTIPHVNPESLHWRRGERDLARFGREEMGIDLELWNESDWVAKVFDDGVVSFDIEDSAMSAVSRKEGKNELLTYHEHEALWTKVFEAYVGSEAEMERILMESFTTGSVRLA
jgi:hypothetical protein